MAFVGRGAGGRKPMAWAKTDKQKLAAFFARQKESESSLQWMFTGGCFEGAPQQQSAFVGDRVHDVIFDVVGRLVRKGHGSEPGQGTCQAYWL